MRYETKCVKGKCKLSDNKADRTPIYQNNLYKAGEDNFYCRHGQVNANELSAQLADMYDRPNLPCYITASGMSAISTLVGVLLWNCRKIDKYWAKKDYYKIILPNDLYEETKEYFKLIDSSVKVVYTDFHNISNLEAELSDNTILVFLESLSNPLYEDYDVLAICRATHKYPNAKVAVDNTLLTSYCNTTIRTIIIHLLTVQESASPNRMQGPIGLFIAVLTSESTEAT